jgi:hypothetical protein
MTKMLSDFQARVSYLARRRTGEMHLKVVLNEIHQG